MYGLYNVIEEMKTKLESHGYTTFDIYEFSEKKVSLLDSSKFPCVFIGRQIENVNDNDEKLIGYLSNNAIIDLNIVLNTGESNLNSDAHTNIRKIKDIIATYRCGTYYSKWEMIDNFISQLQSSNDHSSVYGGININTNVLYRENEIEGVL